MIVEYQIDDKSTGWAVSQPLSAVAEVEIFAFGRYGKRAIFYRKINSLEHFSP
jgi:hypothetical protein